MKFYYQTFMVLTNEDPIKLSEVLKLDVNDALQFLNYRIEKNQREMEQIKKIRNKWLEYT